MANIIDPLKQYFRDHRKWSYFGVPIVIFLFLLFARSPGYSIEKGDPGYKEITINKAFAHFSFEYPEYWYDYNVNQWFDDEVSVLILHEADSRLHEDFSLLIKAKIESDKTAEEELKRVKNFRVHPYSAGQVLDQSEIRINGIPGGQLQLIYYDELTDEDYDVPTFLWLVVFDNDEQQYFIQIQADEELTEEAKVYFNHLLDSFRIEND